MFHIFTPEHSTLYVCTVTSHCVSYKYVTGKVTSTCQNCTCVITDTCKYTCRFVSVTRKALTHTNAHVHTTTQPCMHMQYTHTCTPTTVCTQDGDSPLYIASQKGHDRTVEILLQAGATVDLQNKVENYLFTFH